MDAQKILSADSHVIEPADVWTSRIDKRFLDRAPRVIKRTPTTKATSSLLKDCARSRSRGSLSPASIPKTLPKRWRAVTPASVRARGIPSCESKTRNATASRARCCIQASGMRLFQMEDGDLRAACFRAYNDWLADYCAHNPRRLAGVAMVSLDDPLEGVEELRRAANKGLRGAMIWGAAPAERPYSDPSYDPFWAVAHDLGTPISLHILTERRGGSDFQSVMKGYPALHHSVERSLTEIIFAGVLKFPRAPAGIGRKRYRMDSAFSPTPRPFVREISLSRKKETIANPPSFYFRRQVAATLQDDRVGVVTRHFIGVKSLMWGSDFPHSDSTWRILWR